MINFPYIVMRIFYIYIFSVILCGFAVGKFILMILFLHRFVYRGYIKWAIQYNIFLNIEYSIFRVPKSTWQVGAVYSFFCYCRKLLIYKDVYIRRSKRGPPCRFFISQINKKNGESENEGYKIYYCR